MTTVSADQVNILIGLAGLTFTVMLAILGLVVRITISWASMRGDVATLKRDVSEIKSEEASAHADLLGVIREDRAANNDRLSWLERRRRRW